MKEVHYVPSFVSASTSVCGLLGVGFVRAESAFGNRPLRFPPLRGPVVDAAAEGSSSSISKSGEHGAGTAYL